MRIKPVDLKTNKRSFSAKVRFSRLDAGFQRALPRRPLNPERGRLWRTCCVLEVCVCECVCEVDEGLHSVCWTGSNTVASEDRDRWALATGSCNATAPPSETRGNAAKQLDWRLKRLGLESTPNNNINYNNNYMFIYTIYRLKNAML